MKAQTSTVCSYLRIWPRGTRTRVVRVYYPPQVFIIDRVLQIRHKGNQLKVPFAVTRHIFRNHDYTSRFL